MPISLRDLVEELETRPVRDVVSDHVFTGTPVLFSKEPELYEQLTTYLGDQLNIPSDSFFIVGSAKTGYSLSPDTFGRAFSATSDVDFAVVDTDLFDRIWSFLLDWRYPWHIRKWPDRDLTWGVDRLEALICGRCDPHRIKYDGLRSSSLLRPLRDISAGWFNAFQSVGAEFPQLASRSYGGRLYRTVDHALRYHTYGLQATATAYKNSL